jgi:hypothetical protein
MTTNMMRDEIFEQPAVVARLAADLAPYRAAANQARPRRAPCALRRPRSAAGSPPGKRCTGRTQCVPGKEKPAAAWEIADKAAVLRRAYLAAPRRVTPDLILLAVPRFAMPSICDGYLHCTTAAAERHRWPLRRRGRRTARPTLHRPTALFAAHSYLSYGDGHVID